MPVACSTSALTGQEGSIFFKPAGTSFCLLDFTDFPAGSDITVPSQHDYRVGDAVAFVAEGTANLDSTLISAAVYYVVASTATTIQVAITDGGVPVVLMGDGGTGTADTPGSANHIRIEPPNFAVVCQVREFSVEITREELDVTTLPCNVGSSGSGKYAAFRSTQAGYAAGTGTMTVYFTDDQSSLANRLLANVMLKSQDGAEVRLFVNTVSDGFGGADLDASLYIEAGISITSMSLSVNPDDATSAELSFNILDPKNILGTDLTA